MQSLKNTCKSCFDWCASLPLGYKFYAILTITSIILGNFIADWQGNLSNSTSKVIQDYQFWRLLTSFLSNGSFTAWNIILVLLCLWLLKISITSLQTKLSTAYILVELLKQTILINLAVNLVFYPFIYFGMIEGCTIQTGGIMIPTMFFLMQDVARDANGPFAIFGMTCFLNKKYLFVLAMIGMLVMQSMNFIVVLIITVFLMGQYMCRKKPFVALPLGFYQTVDKKLPNCIKSMAGYVQVQAVKDQLIEACEEWWQPSEKQVLAQQQSRQNIKGTTQQKYKHHWINRGQELQQNSHNQQDPGLKSELKLQQNDICDNQRKSPKARGDQISFQPSENIAARNQSQPNYQQEPVEYNPPVGYDQEILQEAGGATNQKEKEAKDKVYNMAVNIQSSVAADDEEEWY